MALANYLTPQSFNRSQFNPLMPKASTARRKDNFMTKAAPFIDAAQIGLQFIPGWGQIASAGLEGIQQIGAGQQNKLNQQYQNQLLQEQNQFNQERLDYMTNQGPSEDEIMAQFYGRQSQSDMNNPYSMNFSMAGGGKKTSQQRYVDDQAFNNSNNYNNQASYSDASGGYMKSGGKWIQKATASIKKRGTEGVCTGEKFGGPTCPPGSKRYNLAKTFKAMAKSRADGGPVDLFNMAGGGGLSRSEDYGSEKKPYPSVGAGDFAGPHRSYPIPTRADAVDALRLAGLHGADVVKQRVYQRYPELRKNANMGGLMNMAGGDYGTIPGQGNSKADDKQVDMQDGSYVIPNDTNSKSDPKIEIAKSLLAFLGHEPNKKYGMQDGGSGDVNISSKEMVLNPKQSDQFDQIMGGEAQKEAFFTPDSQYNNSFINGMNGTQNMMMPGFHQMPDGTMMADEMMGGMNRGGSAVGNKISTLSHEGYPQKQAVAIALSMQRRGDLAHGGKKGLMEMCMQQGGTYQERMLAEGEQLSEEEMNKIVNEPVIETPYEDILEQNKVLREGAFYKGEQTNYPVDVTAPSFYNPQTGMTNLEQQQSDYQKRINDMGYYNMLQDKITKGEQLTPEEMTDWNYNADQGQQNVIPTTTPAPTVQSSTGADPFKDAQKMNKLVHGLEAGAVVGMGLYNLLTKYQPGQKPLDYNPMVRERDYMGLENQLEKQTQLAGATARYNARNLNQTSLTNAAIHANELQQLNKNSAMIHDLQQQDKLAQANQQNQATLYNMANTNRYNEMESQQRNQFRLMKGQVLSDNISTLSEIGKDYANNKMLIDTAQKGTQIDRVFKEYMNWKTYESMKDSNNPIVKRDEKGSPLMKKDAQGNSTSMPEYYTFEEYLAKSGL